GQLGVRKRSVRLDLEHGTKRAASAVLCRAEESAACANLEVKVRCRTGAVCGGRAEIVCDGVGGRRIGKIESVGRPQSVGAAGASRSPEVVGCAALRET